MVDEHGHAPPPPTYETYLHVPMWLTVAASGGLALPYYAVRSGRRLLARRKRNKRLRAATQVATIGSAAPGIVCLQGQVRILQAVKHPGDGSDCGLFEHRKLVKDRMRRTGFATYSRAADRWVTERGRGRLVISDETGVVLLDDDYVELLQSDGKAPNRYRPCDLRVVQGARVQVVGQVIPCVDADVLRQVDAPSFVRGYRGQRSILSFDGRPDYPLSVRVLGTEPG